MKRFTLALILVLAPFATEARTLDLAFMPPPIEPQELCSANPAPDNTVDTSVTVGPADGLTDALRLRYILRDIQRLQTQDANRWFDFLMTLIDWRAKIAPEFAGPALILAQIQLYVDAGRLADLQAAGLIPELRQQDLTLSNGQKMALSQYYLNGIAVAADPDYARGLIRDAAFGGNAEALLSLARMDLQGNPVPGWTAPVNLTVTLALGGMLGQMDKGVCVHAERIAREYISGDVVTHNPAIAEAWYRFSADLGGADAAWRVVQYYQNADAAHKDNTVMLHYLQLAVQRGITIKADQISRIKASADFDAETLNKILGYNFSQDTGRTRPSLSPYLQLAVTVDAEKVDITGPYLAYLREVIKFDTAPGFVFSALANEILLRQGEWAGEPEAMPLLEQAAAKMDPEGMQRLAQKLLRYRRDPARLNRAINLLSETVSRFGMMSSMNDLDTLYRCQAPDAPLPEADIWSANYRATDDAVVAESDSDYISLDPFKKPELIAKIQSQALDGRPQALAAFLERIQLDPLASNDAQRLWAQRTSQSDKALELFAELEFSLATNPAERDLAVELFRRVYLNNGVTTALDLSIALVEDNSRDPAIAKEIIDMLTKAGNRGEGGAIRLKARLLAEAGLATEQSVYDEFKQVIEDRGDFLALMFAMPYISPDRTADYTDRAVSLMNCTTKDADELGDAAAVLQSPDDSFHWRRVGLAVVGGHTLAKLALSDDQFGLYNQGAVPSPVDVLKRALAEGDLSAERGLYLLTGDPDLKSFDPAAAAAHLLAVLAQTGDANQAWVLDTYRQADPAIRVLVEKKINIADIYLKAAQRGDITAKLDYALLLRDTAKNVGDLVASARWLKEAADAGNVAAMADLGRALAFGLGVAQDRTTAIAWLEQAGRGGDTTASDLARLLRLEAKP